MAETARKMETAGKITKAICEACLELCPAPLAARGGKNRTLSAYCGGTQHHPPGQFLVRLWIRS
jgi:hypothetical protein